MSPARSSSRQPDDEAPLRALVAGVSRDSLALARALLREGARVTIAEPKLIHPSFGLPLTDALKAELGAAGATFGDLGSVKECDVVFLDHALAGFVGGREDWLEEAGRHGVTVSNLADYVADRAPTQVIGVTGTAGKSTVSALAAHLLDSGGVTVHTVRDRGTEMQLAPTGELVEELDGMRSGFVLMELQSYNLEFMNTSPNIAVVTNLAPDHVHDHGSFEAYVEAKQTVVRHQGPDDWAILFDDESVLTHFAPLCRGRTAYFGYADHGHDNAVFVRGSQLVGRLDGTEVELGDAPTDQVHLQNVLAASATALVAGAEPGAVASTLPSLPGMRYRRELVAEHDDIQFINDSLATTPLKARAGLEAMERPVVWIAGGRATYQNGAFDHDNPAYADLTPLAAAAQGRVRAAFFFGPAAPDMREPLENVGVAVDIAPDIETVVAPAIRAAQPGDVVLFSPGCYVGPEIRERFDALAQGAVSR